MSAGGDVQAVVFGLGQEMFALPVATVREILDHRDASAIPHGPAWLLGLVVDRVLDVSSFPSSAIEAAPDIGVRWRSDYMQGVVRRADGFVVLLAIDSIFSGEGEILALPGIDQAA